MEHIINIDGKNYPDVKYTLYCRDGIWYAEQWVRANIRLNDGSVGPSIEYISYGVIRECPSGRIMSDRELARL